MFCNPVFRKLWEWGGICFTIAANFIPKWCKLLVYFLYSSPDPPEFAAGSGVVNRSAIEGSTFSLDCSWSSNPNGSIEFRLQDVDMQSNVMHDVSSQLVTVTGAVAGNEGRYICTVSSPVAITQLIYNVIVGGNVRMATSLWLVLVATCNYAMGSVLVSWSVKILHALQFVT